MRIAVKLFVFYGIIAGAVYSNSLTQESGSDRQARLLKTMQKMNWPKDRRIDTSAKGDYARLQYTICMNRPGKYKLGEPIFICGYVKNMSDSTVHIMNDPPMHLFSVDKVTLKNADANNVAMTCAGRMHDEWFTKNASGRKPPVFNSYGTHLRMPLPSVRRLESQAEMELPPGPIVLNHYFDLAQPGIYHLRFYRVTFCNAQEYDEPLASNTLTFEVLDEFVMPDDLKNPGEFNWPPRDAPGETPVSSTPDAVKPPAE